MAQDNNNAVVVSTIPFDLEVEILWRLPVKSLLQFRCVCKSWNSLISDPKFAKKHLRYSQKDLTHHHIMTNLKYDKEVLMAFPLQSVLNAAVTATATLLEYPLNEQVDFIVGSCDGILCLDLDIDISSPLLWNPSLRRFNKLPSLENLGYRECYTSFGFGYDHFTDKYKVVAVFCYQCDVDDDDVDDDDDDDFLYYKSKTLVKVHTVGTDSWRLTQDFGSCGLGRKPGKFLSHTHTLNWLSDDNNYIVSFHLGKESYQQLFLPLCGIVFWGLGVFRDCLCVISRPDDYAAVSDIWLMKEYGNKDSWTKLFRMNMMGLDLIPYLLHISEDAQVLLLDNNRGQLVLYNSRDATFKIPQSLDLDSMVYVESLISPCG